jgi:hypothetical protein
MIHRIIIIILLTLFFFFNMKFLTEREYIKPLDELYNLNPTTYKIGTNLYSSFFADKFWLISSNVNEKKLKKTEEEIKKIKKGYLILNSLDKNFVQPIIYAVAYLIINQNHYQEGMNLLNEALKKSPKNSKLLFQKLIYITTYNPKKPDIKEVMRIAKELYKQNIIYIGRLKVSDFVAETIDYYTKNKNSKIDNLKRLLKFTKNEEIQNDIKEILKQYEKNKTEGDNNE